MRKKSTVIEIGLLYREIQTIHFFSSLFSVFMRHAIWTILFVHLSIWWWWFAYRKYLPELPKKLGLSDLISLFCISFRVREICLKTVLILLCFILFHFLSVCMCVSSSFLSAMYVIHGIRFQYSSECFYFCVLFSHCCGSFLASSTLWMVYFSFSVIFSFCCRHRRRLLLFVVDESTETIYVLYFK